MVSYFQGFTINLCHHQIFFQYIDSINTYFIHNIHYIIFISYN